MSAAPAAIAQRLLRSGLQYARVRLEILELEISAERDRVGAMMKSGLVMSLAALTTVQFIAMLVLALYWDTAWRFHALGGLILFSASATALAWWMLRRLRREEARPLASALRDLERIAVADDDT